VIDSRRKVREEVETEGTDYSDHFPAFSTRFSSYKYPEGFKPIGITKDYSDWTHTDLRRLHGLSPSLIWRRT
jgi:hypothetical protein